MVQRGFYWSAYWWRLSCIIPPSLIDNNVNWQLLYQTAASAFGGPDWSELLIRDRVRGYLPHYCFIKTHNNSQCECHHLQNQKQPPNTHTHTWMHHHRLTPSLLSLKRINGATKREKNNQTSTTTAAVIRVVNFLSPRPFFFFSCRKTWMLKVILFGGSLWLCCLTSGMMNTFQSPLSGSNFRDREPGYTSYCISREIHHVEAIFLRHMHTLITFASLH